MLAAAMSNDPVVTRLLLGAGADLNLKDDDGKTAFDYAENNENTAVVALFAGLKASLAPETSEASEASDVKADQGAPETAAPQAAAPEAAAPAAASGGKPAS